MTVTRFAPSPTGYLHLGHVHSALVGWHIPAALTLGMQSPTWHAIEHASFLAAGLLFWWPVVQPWPKSSADRGWSIVP